MAESHSFSVIVVSFTGHNEDTPQFAVPEVKLREWLGPGGLPGLQNRWRVALRAAVGSTPIHSRLLLIDGGPVSREPMNDFNLQDRAELIQPIIDRLMEIEDITWGTPDKPGDDPPKPHILVRFRGQLRVDASQAQLEIRKDLISFPIAAVFSREGNQDVIVLVEDRITSLIAPYMKIEETTWGASDPLVQGPTYRRPYLVRYLGQLSLPSDEAYDKVADRLRPQDITPFFRKKEDKHEIILVQGLFESRPSNPWINLILFLLTLASVLVTGVINSLNEPAPETLPDLVQTVIANLDQGMPFAASILAILLAHEFGHYLAGRYHGTAVTLPYFIPFPSLFGTLGAFIQLKEPPKNRRVLLDIGIAGPIAGFVLSIPILLYGLSLSELDTLPAFIPPDQGFLLEGNSILYLLAKFAIFQEWLPAPASYGDLSPLVYWIRYFFTGLPAPLGGTDVLIHPVAWAGWAGLLVTALNLIPAGQLDGGHIIYTLLGSRARRLIPFILGGLFLLGFVWTGWWLWGFLIFFLGRAHAEPLDQITKLDPRRQVLAVIGLIIFILVFIPVPLRTLANSGIF